MQTHRDSDTANEFLQRLSKRADRMLAAGESEITSGKPGEEPLAVWRHGDIQVTHMPDDPDGVLRLSIGGGDDTPVKCNYLVFRGDVGKCESLLRKALAAITKYK